MLDTIGERIIYLRNSRGMTQRKLMDELNITNLGRVEKNVGLPGIDMIVSISNYFNVTTDWLLKGKLKENNTSSHNCLQCQKYNYLIKLYNKLSDSDKSTATKVIEALVISDITRRENNKAKIKLPH